MSAALTLFFGTFIQLPRTPVNGKHVLAIQKGALWASATDGRIKGLDWNVQDEDGLRALMRKNGWTSDGPNGFSEGTTTEKVNVVRAREENNEFFFPGFIGMSVIPI